MRAVFGLLLIMLGLAMAVVWMPAQNSEQQLAVVTQIATQGIPVRQDSSDRVGRTFSPATPLLATVEAPGSARPVLSAGMARVVAPQQTATPVVDAPPLPPAGRTTNVVAHLVPGSSVIQQGPAVAQPMGKTDTPTSRPPQSTEMSRYDLVRTLQRELKRVGCYWGDIDGDWGTGSRRAMAAFTERVNASLPIDQPDSILLTLVQGQQGAVCGKGCPAGQTMSDAGRCLPNAVVAQTRRGQDRRSPAREDVAPAPSEQAASAAHDNGWRTQVSKAAEPAGRTWTETVSTERAAAVAMSGAAAVAAATLPGRMSVGGPVAAPNGWNGAAVAPAPERGAARSAVRSATATDATETGGTVGPAATATRRERTRRAAGQRVAPAYRYVYAAPAPVYRAPRVSPPRYYASAPRRSRSWTASFFNLN
jgi:hypothetical protein